MLNPCKIGVYINQHLYLFNKKSVRCIAQHDARNYNHQF